MIPVVVWKIIFCECTASVARGAIMGPLLIANIYSQMSLFLGKWLRKGHTQSTMLTGAVGGGTGSG
jgi:hypothetical protein